MFRSGAAIVFFFLPSLFAIEMRRESRPARRPARAHVLLLRVGGEGEGPRADSKARFTVPRAPKSSFIVARFFLPLPEIEFSDERRQSESERENAKQE